MYINKVPEETTINRSLNMPSMKILRDLKTKSDAKNPRPTITAGTSCDVRFYKKDNHDLMEVKAPNGAVWNFSTIIGIQFFKKLPSQRQIENWVYDSVCSTPLGNRVEPDGYDKHGCPSWLLILRLI
jgi:hypothetical protein